jgi:hypothetical protein
MLFESEQITGGIVRGSVDFAEMYDAEESEPLIVREIEVRAVKAIRNFLMPVLRSCAVLFPS